MPPAIGGRRGQDLSKSTVARLAIGGLFVGSLLIVSAISYDNTITPRGIVIHHSSVMPAIIQLGPNATDRLPLDLDSWDQFHRIRGRHGEAGTSLTLCGSARERLQFLSRNRAD